MKLIKSNRVFLVIIILIFLIQFIYIASASTTGVKVYVVPYSIFWLLMPLLISFVMALLISFIVYKLKKKKKKEELFNFGFMVFSIIYIILSMLLLYQYYLISQLSDDLFRLKCSGFDCH